MRLKLSLILPLCAFCFIAACNDPGPLVVTAPKSISTKAINIKKDNELVLLLNEKETIGYRMNNEADSSTRKVQNPTVGDIKAVIATAKEKVEKAGKRFSVLIVSDNNAADYKTFKLVIDALKDQNIFKFSMITTAELKESK